VRKVVKVLVALGVIVVVIGVVAYVVLPIPVSSIALVSEEPLSIRGGSSVPRTFHIPNDAYVSGTINEVTGGNNDIDFYVFDKYNYNNWVGGQASVHYQSIYRAGTGSPFSFRTDKEGDFYFVFDNPVGGWLGSDRSIRWSASYQYRPYAFYGITVGIPLGIIGVIVVSSAVYLEYETRRKAKLEYQCPSCGKTVSVGLEVCPYCKLDLTKYWVRCKYCKKLYDSHYDKCPRCGAPPED